MFFLNSQLSKSVMSSWPLLDIRDYTLDCFFTIVGNIKFGFLEFWILGVLGFRNFLTEHFQSTCPSKVIYTGRFSIFFVLFSCPDPTLGHYQGDSFTKPMLITAFDSNFHVKITRSLLIR